jgi:hypothetical protein
MFWRWNKIESTSDLSVDIELTVGRWFQVGLWLSDVDTMLQFQRRRSVENLTLKQRYLFHQKIKKMFWRWNNIESTSDFAVDIELTKRRWFQVGLWLSDVDTMLQFQRRCSVDNLMLKTRYLFHQKLRKFSDVETTLYQRGISPSIQSWQKDVGSRLSYGCLTSIQCYNFNVDVVSITERWNNGIYSIQK